jgi:hypothetical protein
LLDIFLAYKTIEFFIRWWCQVAKEIAVSGQDRLLDDVWGGTEFRSLAEHSL